jgi:toxin ParE1/3/4
MGFKVVLHDAAIQELDDALEWYSKISTELSEDLLQKFIEASFTLEINPFINSELNGGYGKLNLERFPYKLVYKIFPDEVLIVALAHHKRLPFYWKKR